MSPAPISASTSRVTASWSRNVGSLASTTCSSSDASRASSSVERNDATRSCGSFLMNPTVSLTSTAGHTLGVQRAHGGVERREELVGDVDLAAR
jgi:hypothetical protein